MAAVFTDDVMVYNRWPMVIVTVVLTVVVIGYMTLGGLWVISATNQRCGWCSPAPVCYLSGLGDLRLAWVAWVIMWAGYGWHRRGLGDVGDARAWWRPG